MRDRGGIIVVGDRHLADALSDLGWEEVCLVSHPHQYSSPFNRLAAVVMNVTRSTIVGRVDQLLFGMGRILERDGGTVVLVGASDWLRDNSLSINYDIKIHGCPEGEPPQKISEELLAGECAAPAPDPIIDAIKRMLETAQERGGRYGRAYLRFGAVAKALWPDGLHATSEDDFVRLGITVQIINKLVRYTGVEGGHQDSAHDLAVYGAMLESVTK